MVRSKLNGFLCAVLSLLLFVLPVFSSCGKSNEINPANSVINSVNADTELLLSAVEEMKKFKCDRIYVAWEKKEKDENDTSPDEYRLCTYEKESGERTEIENETLREVLTKFGLALILFQTASDSRQSVIFSFSKESGSSEIKKGFYYSFDSKPAAWWGRKGVLIKDHNRYLQLNKDGSAWYYTVKINEYFYYFEKSGDLVA